MRNSKRKRNYRKELDAELAAQKNEIYNEGVAHGRNLLNQLNSGEITAKDIDAFIKKILIMTELQLYKFVNNNGCEWHWNPDGHLMIFISPYYLKDFCDMLGRNAFDDGGLNCEQHLCADGDVALNEFENLLEDYGIEPENVFPKDEEE